MIFTLLILLFAYILGSVPWGFLAGKMRGVDLRKVGSGNIGATNALRTLGKPIGILVFLLDFSKGVVAVFVARWAGQPEWVEIVAGVLAILGHNFPVWLGFRGGKGIATTTGVLIALFPLIVVGIGLLTWAAFFFATKFVSLASIAAAVAIGLVCLAGALLGWMSWLLAGVGVALGVLAVFRHRSNIRRLLDGTESRFGTRKTEETPSEP